MTTAYDRAMASLLDLTTQGDVGTITDESQLPSIHLMDPQQLYELWERQHWMSAAIDFTRDRADWARIPEGARRQLAWNLSGFFIGEERVTTQFGGLVGAYENQSEEAFLCSQQVDEARHAQLFNRFFAEVVGVDGDFEERLAWARAQLSAPFEVLFDRELTAANRRLLDDPADLEAKVEYVTVYMMVIEGTLALTGQHLLTSHLEREGLLPGFLEGFRHVARDEHRHVAYGTWFLQQKCADAHLRRVARDKLAALLPLASQVLVPPGTDREREGFLGYTNAQADDFAYTALSRRLRVVGIDLGPQIGP